MRAVVTELLSKRRGFKGKVICIEEVAFQRLRCTHGESRDSERSTSEERLN